MRSLYFLVAVLCATCACYSGPVAKTAPTSLIEKLSDETAVILYEDKEDNTHLCSGVWVGDYRILTAAHCVRGEDGEILSPLLFGVLQTATPGEAPAHLHSAEVAKVDAAHDLALLKTGIDTPIHSTAMLALAQPRVGEELHIFGHPMMYYWSYGKGWVSAYRAPDPDTEDDAPGPWMQVATVGVAPGNSGGGAFNSAGELVGVDSRHLRKAMSIAFFVPLDTIRTFLNS